MLLTPPFDPQNNPFVFQNIDPEAAIHAKATGSESAPSGRMAADMEKACQQLDIEGEQCGMTSPQKARAVVDRTPFRWQWMRDATGSRGPPKT